MVERVLISGAIVCLALGIAGQAQQTSDRRPATPSAAVRAKQRDVFLQACGRCHPPERVTATRRTKAQWEESINQMVTARGASFTAEEINTVLTYLVREYGPTTTSAGSPGNSIGVAVGGARGGTTAGTGTTRPAPPEATAQGTPGTTRSAGQAPAVAGGPPAGAPRPRGGAGPDDKHIVDSVAANRGRKTYASSCIQCHGTQARGTDRGANIVRSLVLLKDRYGNTLGPFLKKGHPQSPLAGGSGPPSTSFTEAQVADLSHFLHERLNDTLRGSPIFTVQDVLTGDRRAGEAYFHGDGGCTQCHSPTGDLKGIGAKYDPPGLQQRFLFPRPPGRRGPGGGGAAPPVGKPVTVTVTAGAQTVSGVLVSLDDFNVALRDANGAYRSFKRTADVTVVKNDPYAAHVALLDKYTDKNMHDIVAYLESLK